MGDGSDWLPLKHAERQLVTLKHAERHLVT